MTNLPNRLFIGLIAACLAGTCATPSASALTGDKPPATQAERCQGTLIDVVARSKEEQSAICGAARKGVELVAACGINLKRPLQIHVMPRVWHPHGRWIFGYLDTKEDRVYVSRASEALRLAEGTPYATIPLQNFYDSLVIHELVHAVLQQNLRRPVTSQAAHEYPAYAIQIASLPAPARSQFLKAFSEDGLKSQKLFNDAILGFDPYFFAASAYMHFKSASDGCAEIRAITLGEVDFIAAR